MLDGVRAAAKQLNCTRLNGDCESEMTREFECVEATVGDIHDAMAAGRLTARELVERYVERIEAYDRDGPELNAIVTVNPAATERAADLDRAFEESGPTGPLHGIPVLVKDQAMTAGLRTTFGSEAFAEYVPETDATVVSKVRDAGGIVLAKTNLPDWAGGDAGYSSVLGQTRNPYALDRDPGGSSAGTGAAVAANFGTVGIGEDTGGSIRVPSAHCNLFGLRVTTGLISRHGLSPLIRRQDTPGPMARTLEDMVRLLDVLVGYDHEDGYTGNTVLAGEEPYLDALDPRGLEGARVGVLRGAFGSEDDPDCAPVNGLVEDAIDTLERGGAETVDPVSIPDLDEKLDRTWLYGMQSRADLDGFLADLPDAPASSFEEVYESGAYYEGLPVLDALVSGPADPREDVEYWKKVQAQRDLQADILSVFAEHDLDAIALPDVKVVPRDYEHLQNTDASERTSLSNTYIASQSGCPAISMPAGLTDEGFPAGVQLLGAPYSERRLLALAAGYESLAETRTLPSTAPGL